MSVHYARERVIAALRAAGLDPDEVLDRGCLVTVETDGHMLTAEIRVKFGPRASDRIIEAMRKVDGGSVG